MTKRAVNPWEWQNRAGFSQAWRVDGAAATPRARPAAS